MWFCYIYLVRGNILTRSQQYTTFTIVRECNLKIVNELEDKRNVSKNQRRVYGQNYVPKEYTRRMYQEFKKLDENKL